MKKTTRCEKHGRYKNKKGFAPFKWPSFYRHSIVSLVNGYDMVRKSDILEDEEGHDLYRQQLSEGNLYRAPPR